MDLLVPEVWDGHRGDYAQGREVGTRSRGTAAPADAALAAGTHGSCWPALHTPGKSQV